MMFKTAAWVHILGSLFSSCVNLGKSLKLSVFEFLSCICKKKKKKILCLPFRVDVKIIRTNRYKAF